MANKIISSSNQALDYIGTFLSGAVNDINFLSIKLLFADPNNPNNWTATEIQNAIDRISSTQQFLDGNSTVGFIVDAKNNLVGTFYNALITRLQQLKGEIITIHDPLLKYTLNAYVRGATSNKLYQSLTNNNQGNTPESSATWQLVENQNQIRVILSNNALDLNNDIDFAPGFIVLNNGTKWTATAKTKRLDANWVAGTNQGGLDTGTKQINTQYHCYSIYNPTTLQDDYVYSTNTSIPLLPSGFTAYQYINTIRTDASGNIIRFTQFGQRTELNVSIQTHSNVAQANNTEILRTLSSAGVPLGRNVKVFGTCSTAFTGGQSGVAYLKIYSASKNQTTLNANEGVTGGVIHPSYGYSGSGDWNAITNTSSQVKSNSIGSVTLASININVDGWEFID